MESPPLSHVLAVLSFNVCLLPSQFLPENLSALCVSLSIFFFHCDPLAKSLLQPIGDLHKQGLGDYGLHSCGESHSNSKLTMEGLHS